MAISKLQRELISIQQVVEKYSPDQAAMIEEYINEIDSKPDDTVLDEFNELIQKLQQAVDSKDLAAYQTAANNVIKKYDEHPELYEIASERVDQLRRAVGFNEASERLTKNLSAAISDRDNELALSELKELKKVYSDYRYQFPDTLKAIENDLTSQPPVQVTDRLNNLIRTFNERPNADLARNIIALAKSDAIVSEMYDLSQLEEYVADSEQLEVARTNLRRLLRGE